MRTKLIRTTLPVILERGGEEFSAIDSESDTKIKWRVLNVVTPSITAQKQSMAACTACAMEGSGTPLSHHQSRPTSPRRRRSLPKKAADVKRTESEF